MSRGESKPLSGWPYILGSFPYSPGVGSFSGVTGRAGETARRRFGTGEPGGCGVEGHAGCSRSAKPEFAELRGSNMVAQGQVLSLTGTASPLYYVIVMYYKFPT